MMNLEQQNCFKLDQQRLCEVMSVLRLDDGINTSSIVQNPLVMDTLLNSKMSLIHLACYVGNVRLVTALIEQGEDINSKTGEGSACLHILCSNANNVNSSLRLLDIFLQSDLNLNAQDSSGKTALFLACCNNMVPIVEKLIQAGCNVNIPDNEDNTAFTMSCCLASDGWYFWNTDCCNNDNGFMEQSSFPSLLICQALLQAGADTKQATILPSAILYGTKEIVKEFLDLGMDVNSMDKNRRSPLGCACSTPSIPSSMVKLLLEYNADVNEDGGGGKSKPMILAFVHNSVDKIKLLLSYGAAISTEEMSELVSVSLSKWFLENPEVICEDSKELLSWRLLIKAGFRPQLDMYVMKLKRVYLCSSYSKVSKIIDSLLYPLNSLSDICRISIRSQLSPSIDDNVDYLPLPNRLKKFLKFDEFSIHNCCKS